METDLEYTIVCETNKGQKIKYEYVIPDVEVDCDVRVEECHGYHTFYDIDDRDYERQWESHLEDITDEDLTEALRDEALIDEDEKVISWVDI